MEQQRLAYLQRHGKLKFRERNAYFPRKFQTHFVHSGFVFRALDGPVEILAAVQIDVAHLKMQGAISGYKHLDLLGEIADLTLSVKLDIEAIGFAREVHVEM